MDTLNEFTATRMNLVRRLLALPGEAEAAEMDVFHAQERLSENREILADEEAELLLRPFEIDGKNVEQRQAQIRRKTVVSREAVEATESLLRQAQVALRRKRDELSALKAVARLLGSSEE